MNPGRNVSLPQDYRTCLFEYSVSGNVIEMVVGVHNKLDRQLGQFSNLGQELICRGFVFKGINDQHAVLTDEESGIGAGVALGVVDRRIRIAAERLQGKGKPAWRGWRGLGAGAKGGEDRKE